MTRISVHDDRNRCSPSPERAFTLKRNECSPWTGIRNIVTMRRKCSKTCGRFTAHTLLTWGAEASMISPANANHAPLSCRWILFRQRSDFLRANNWTRAICERDPYAPRVVTEKDCRGCKFWGSPQRVRGRHLSDEGTDLTIDGWAAARSGFRPSGPSAAEPVAMPPQHGVRLHDNQGGPPLPPPFCEQDPKESIARAEPLACDGAGQYGQLLTKGQVLKRDRSVSAAHQSD